MPRPSRLLPPSRAGFSQTRLDEAGQSVLAARQVGVDLAKSAFVKSCCTLALKAVVVGIAAALTAASFGGAAPLLGLACASMAISACDSVCAYRNFKNADADAQGLPKPYGELRYNNSLMNLAHCVAAACGMSDNNAGTAAKVTAVVVGGGLAVAAFALSLGMSGVPEVLALVSDCTSGVRAAYAVVSAGAELYAVSGNREAVRTQLGAAEHALGGILQDDRFLVTDDQLNNPQEYADFMAAHEKLLALMNNDAEESPARGTSLQGTTGKAINGACMSLGLLAMVPEVAEVCSNLLQV